jgi:hypothetical protein
MPLPTRQASRAVLLGALLLGVSALAGCGGSDRTDSGRVATIAGTASAASSAPGANPDGVMLRIDMTQAEIDAVNATYYACLGAHGVKLIAKPSGQKVPAQEEKDNPAGYRACTAKKPYLDPLLDKTKNPKYPDQFRTWLACMNQHGVEVSGAWDDEFLNFGQRAPGIDGKKYLEIYRQCDIAAYKW